MWKSLKARFTKKGDGGDKPSSKQKTELLQNQADTKKNAKTDKDGAVNVTGSHSSVESFPKPKVFNVPVIVNLPDSENEELVVNVKMLPSEYSERFVADRRKELSETDHAAIMKHPVKAKTKSRLGDTAGKKESKSTSNSSNQEKLEMSKKDGQFKGLESGSSSKLKLSDEVKDLTKGQIDHSYDVIAAIPDSSEEFVIPEDMITMTAHEERLEQITAIKAKYMKMDLKTKRKLYSCGENFLINEQIPSWSDVNRHIPDSSEVLNPNKFAAGELFKADVRLNEKVALWHGDITRLEIDAVVNSTSSLLMDMPVGVNKAIRKAAGSQLDLELKVQWHIVSGTVYKTSGYNLPAKWIFHTSGPVNRWEDTDKVFYLSKCYTSALNLLKDSNLRTIAFPCIAAGDKGISAVMSAECALRTVRKWLEENHEFVDKVIFCIFEKAALDIYNKTMHMMFPTTKNSPEVTPPRKKRAKVVYSYEPENDDEIKLEIGDMVDILKQEEEGWWVGTVNGRTGIFPSNFVEELTEDGTDEKKAPSLPVEILRMDSKSIELYKQALEDGMEEDYSIRIMVVGPFGVGKTAFTNRLLSQDVNINERNSTDGIDVHVRRCKVSLKTQQWIVDAPDEGDETLKRIAKVLGSTHKQHTDSFSNQNSEVLDSDPIDGGSAVMTVDVNTDEEDLVERTRGQDTDKLDNLKATGDEKTVSFDCVDSLLDPEDNNSSFFNQNPLKNEDMLIKELKEVVANAENTDDSQDYAKVSVWDFGGQFVFYTTHQMFLTHRAIYILISNMSQHIGDLVIDDEPYFDCSGSRSFKIEDFVDIWLNSIHGHSKVDKSREPPVILVGTHTDNLNPNQREEHIEAMFDAIRNRFAGNDVSLHFIDKDFGLSNAFPDPKFEELRETITEVAKQQTYWGELKPAKWIPLEKMLEDLRKNGVEIISRKTLEQLNSTLPVPITRDEELDLFLRFQHETANIMYFSIPELRDQIVLSPQFLVNALKSLITAEMFCKKKSEILDKWKEFRQKGILRQSLLDAVWKKEENQSFHENRHHILNLMEHLNIIARPLTYSDSEENQDCLATQGQDFFLAPCMLKESPPQSMFHSDGAFITTPCVCLSLGNVAFPSSIFSRLLVSCLSRWPLARSGNKHLIYCGCGQFDVDRQHRLTLSFISNVIQLRITRYSEKDRHPSVPLCKKVLDTVKLSLRRIGECLSLALDIEDCVKCPVGGLGSAECRYSVQEIQGCKELPCHRHGHVAILHSADLLKYWFESEAADSNLCTQCGVLPEEVSCRVPTDKELAQISKGIGKEFHFLGIQLGLSQAKLEQIQMTYSLNVADQIFHILLEWRKQRGTLATFNELEKGMLAVGVDTLSALAEIR